MYGSADAHLVYGFNMNDYNTLFDYDWLYENFPVVECYGKDIVRCYLGEAVYGITCKIDVETGKISEISEPNKTMIHTLYYKYIEYIRTKNSGNIDRIKLGYHLVVSGWDETEHKMIRL